MPDSDLREVDVTLLGRPSASVGRCKPIRVGGILFGHVLSVTGAQVLIDDLEAALKRITDDLPSS